VAALLLAVAVGWPLRRWLLTRLGRDPKIPAPDFGRRVLAAAAGGIGRGLLPSLAIVAVALTLMVGDPAGLFAVLVRSLAVAVVAVVWRRRWPGRRWRRTSRPGASCRSTTPPRR